MTKPVVKTSTGSEDKEIPARRCTSCGIEIDDLLNRMERIEKIHPGMKDMLNGTGLPGTVEAVRIEPEPDKPNFNDEYCEIGKDFSQTINRRNAEASSNTPDFILGESLARMLDVLHRTIAQRDRWGGVKLHPCGSNALAEKKIEVIILDFLKWKRKNEIVDYANDQFLAQAFASKYRG